ncbi:MAG: SH3 domain-containing protein, partial [Bacteroidota bacterium]
LNKVILYPDSSFFAHSNTFYEEGTLFEIINETRFEYEDEAQNQKFKWYEVKAPDNQTGWIFGDGIAVLVADEDVPISLSNYHKRIFNFSDELEETVAWVAAIEGKDNFHEEDYLNPLYKEMYLVFTSNLGKSYHIQIAGESAMGTSDLKAFYLQDLTDDNSPELLFLKSSFDNGNPLENQTLEIYSFQAGSIAKVFEERMTLAYMEKIPSPSLFKFVDVNQKTIRIAFVDYVDCSDYSLTLAPNMLDEDHEKCLEYSTYSFIWHEQQKRYSPFYEESRTYVEGQLLPEKGYLRSEPSYLSEIVEKLPASSTLRVVQHFEKIIELRGEKKVVPYFYVQSASGKYGYIHAKDVTLQTGEHSTILNRFYKNPPLDKEKWSVDTNFLHLKIDDNRAMLTKKE